jgi:hypothetical protein
MDQDLRDYKKMLLDRRSWLHSLMRLNDEMLLNYLPSFIDDSNLVRADLAEKEPKYQDALLHLRACHNMPIVSNAKAIADIQTETIVDAAGELKSVRRFIPIDDTDIPTLPNVQNPHNEFPTN